MITRRNFLKTLSGAPILLYSCASTKPRTGGRRKLLYSFIFCNDLHVTTGQHADYFAESIENWSSFSALYDFVVIGGDMANNGFAKELEKVVEKIGGKEGYTLIMEKRTIGLIYFDKALDITDQVIKEYDRMKK